MSDALLPPKPEILSPAGNWECAVAAVENGADAIYFGASHFNARARADNFTLEDLPALMRMLHRRGVRGYITFNILLFTDELESAKKALIAIMKAGVDAAIVQDVGACRLIRALSPDFPIHASTQMSVTDAAGARFAENLGASLAVLARENSLAEIAQIHREVPALPLETFVHGALCVAYSGQCLTSEALGGRSANRGECAQACRMPYDLVCDGQTLDLGDKRYLLSPRDLAGISCLPALIKAGVSSLKIEGRLKSPEYVANITRAYRAALDTAYDALLKGKTPRAEDLLAPHRYHLEMGFSRGLSTGWLNGINNRELVHARFGTKRGVFLGEVMQINAPYVSLLSDEPIKAGDGVVFDDGRPDAGEEGARIHEVQRQGRKVQLRFAREDMQWAKLRAGQKLWKTSDPALDRELRQSFTVQLPRHSRAVSFHVSGKVGEPLQVALYENGVCKATAVSEIPLVRAEKHPLTQDSLRKAFDRLGGTALYLESVQASVEGEVMLPVSELNRMRRALVDTFLSARESAPTWHICETAPIPFPQTIPNTPCESAAAQMIALVRTLPQLEAAMEMGCKTLYADFENPKDFRVARQLICNDTSVQWWAAPPRIFKDDEDWVLRQIRAAEPNGFLVRNARHIEIFKDERCRGDFSLNVANPLSAAYFVETCKLEGVTASYDLNIAQLCDMLAKAPAHWFDITLHQHMPLFHMAHCVFCTFLSEGKNYHDCGRPCEKHTVHLRDHLGLEHLLKADAGCRNTLYHAKAQTGAPFVDKLLSLGVRRFRIEFLDEDKAKTATTLRRYRDLLSGKTDGETLWRDLKLMNQLGVTRGTLVVR